LHRTHQDHRSRWVGRWPRFRCHVRQHRKTGGRNQPRGGRHCLRATHARTCVNRAGIGTADSPRSRTNLEAASMAFAVVAHDRCEPADEAAVRAALLRMSELTPAEPANLTYVVHAEAGQPGAFVLYEQYTDRDGFEAHRVTDHFKDLILGRVLPLLTE